MLLMITVMELVKLMLLLMLRVMLLAMGKLMIVIMRRMMDEDEDEEEDDDGDEDDKSTLASNLLLLSAVAGFQEADARSFQRVRETAGAQGTRKCRDSKSLNIADKSPRKASNVC